jgi:hypothetical protein
VVARLLKQMKLSWPAWLGVKDFIAFAALVAFERGLMMIYLPAAYLVAGAIAFAVAWFTTPPARRPR